MQDALNDFHSIDLQQAFGSIIRMNQIFELENINSPFSIHASFLETDTGSKNSKLTSNEGSKFFSAFALELSLLFRPDVIFLFIKDVYRSFQRYIDQIKLLAQSFEAAYRDQEDVLLRKNYSKMSLIFEFVNILINIESTMLQICQQG